MFARSDEIIGKFLRCSHSSMTELRVFGVLLKPGMCHCSLSQQLQTCHGVQIFNRPADFCDGFSWLFVCTNTLSE